MQHCSRPFIDFMRSCVRIRPSNASRQRLAASSASAVAQSGPNEPTVTRITLPPAGPTGASGAARRPPHRWHPPGSPIGRRADPRRTSRCDLPQLRRLPARPALTLVVLPEEPESEPGQTDQQGNLEEESQHNTDDRQEKRGRQLVGSEADTAQGRTTKE